jgi:hypothetical protein
MLFKPEDIETPFQLGTLHLEGRDLLVPCLEIAIGEEPAVMNYSNTLIRLFYWDKEVNHAELRLDGRLKGVRLPTEILDQMIGYGFPSRQDPFIDSETLSWFSAVEARELESEIDDLLG